MTYRTLFVSGALCALLGAGCIEKPLSRPAPQPKSSQAAQPVQPIAEIPQQVRTPKEELLSILQKYSETKSFRAKITIKSSDGDVTGAVEFAKPNRFRALMKSMVKEKPFISEMIVVDEDLFMRPQYGTWIKLAPKKSGKTLGQTIRETMNVDDALAALVRNEQTTVEKAEDTERQCTLYTIQLVEKDQTRNVSICTDKDLPKFVDLVKKEGSSSVEYFDYNAVFTVARPK